MVVTMRKRRKEKTEGGGSVGETERDKAWRTCRRRCEGHQTGLSSYCWTGVSSEREDLHKQDVCSNSVIAT